MDNDTCDFELPDLAALSGFPSEHVQRLPLALRFPSGANLHQQAALYGNFEEVFEQVGEGNLSYNGLVNASAGVYLMGEFEKPAVALLRYGSPVAAASDMVIEQAAQRLLIGSEAWGLGSTIILNRTVDLALASLLAPLRPELILAPVFSTEALKRLRGLSLLAPKTTLRADTLLEARSLACGLIVQDRDRPSLNPAAWSGAEDLGELWLSALFAWRVAKHVRSPGAVFVKGEGALAIASGSYDLLHLPLLAAAIAHKKGQPLAGCIVALDTPLENEAQFEAFAQTAPAAFLHPGAKDAAVDVECARRAKALGFPFIATGRSHTRL